MSTNLNKINLCIIGKPNSGKSTFFNCLLGKYTSPVGDEYGLTKSLITEEFNYKNKNFYIFDTPGLRRRSKVTEGNEKKRNSEVIKLINKVQVIILLIDSIENVTRQDFRLADLSISKNKILFFLFNKIDAIENKKKFISKINIFLKNNYSKYKMINIEFISAKYKKGIQRVLNSIVIKQKLVDIKINKSKLNDFIDHLNKKAIYPKIKKNEIKPKYIVQIKHSVPKYKVFINSKSKAPQIFKKFFDNAFRSYFKLDGIPVIYEFISSKNPYSN